MKSWILPKIEGGGYKQTAVRKQIATWLEKHKGIFSVHDILRAFPKLDKVSVYRTIELFGGLDIVHPITAIDGVQYYELHGNTHHHHIVCTNCHKTACVNCHIPKITVRGFARTHHTFILSGLCASCQKKYANSKK